MISQESYSNNKTLFQAFFMLLGKLVHGELIRQIEYLKVENKILRGKLRYIRVTPSERRRIVKFGVPLGPDIRRFISIVQYCTFRKWVKGRHYRMIPKKRGRNRIKKEIRDLIIRFAKENSWGYTRILGELRKLGVCSISRNTVKNILKENGLDPAPKRGEDSWDAFVKRHFQTIWACDFFSKTVWTILGPRMFHVLFFINVQTRKVHIAGMTEHPTAEWVDKATRSISFLFQDDSKKILVRDRDCKFLGKFDEILKELNTNVFKIPFRSPNLNPYAESWVGTIKRECLNHFFVFGEKHLKYLIKEYVHYYNTVRPHSGKDNDPLDLPMTLASGSIRCKSKLGGLLRHYYRI